MSTRSKAIAALIATVSILFTPLASNAAPSCATVNKYYPAGVAASKFAKNVGNELIGKPRVRASVYKKYRTLDLDKDRIVCEVEKASASSKAEPGMNQFLANINNSVSESNKINIVSSSTVHPDFLASVTKNLMMAADATDEIVSLGKVSVYLFTVKDSVWLQEQLNSTGGGYYMPASNAQEYLSRSRTEDCGQAFVAKSMFFQCTPYDGTGWDASVHEYFHMVQDRLGQFGTNNTPLWMFEGAATAFQDLISKTSLGNAYQYRNMSKEDIAERLEILETTSDPGARILNQYDGYRFGGATVKYLVNKYGYEKFVDFNKRISSSQNWKSLFQEIYGTDTKSFYLEVAENISVMYN